MFFPFQFNLGIPSKKIISFSFLLSAKKDRLCDWKVVCVCVCVSAYVCGHVCIMRVLNGTQATAAWRTEVSVYSSSEITELMKDCSLIISISKIICFEHFKSLVLLFMEPVDNQGVENNQAHAHMSVDTYSLSIS